MRSQVKALIQKMPELHPFINCKCFEPDSRSLISIIEKLAMRKEKPNAKPEAMLKLVKSLFLISFVMSVRLRGNGWLMTFMVLLGERVKYLSNVVVSRLTASGGTWYGWLLKWLIRVSLFLADVIKDWVVSSRLTIVTSWNIKLVLWIEMGIFLLLPGSGTWELQVLGKKWKHI